MRTFAAVLLLGLIASSPLATAPQDQVSLARPGADPSTVLRVHGQVRSDDDSATQLRRVKVALMEGEAPPVFTDAEGRFEIAVPAADAFTLRFTKAGFAPQQIAGARILAAGPIDVRLARGAAVAGRVVDESGAPVVAAGVRLRSVGVTANNVPTDASTRTDDLGEFRIGSLPAGRYEVVVENNSVVTVVEAGAGVWTMRMGPPPPSAEKPEAEPSQSLVQVRAAEEASVILVPRTNPGAAHAGVGFSVGFGAGGDINVEAVHVEDNGTPPTRGTGVITGYAIGTGGRPVAGATVRLMPVTPGLTPRVVGSGTDGAFRFTAVAAGSYRLAASKVGFIAGESGTVLTLREDQRLDRIDLALTRGAVIAGTVTDVDGEPLEGLAMQVWRATLRDGRAAAEMAADVPLRHTDDRGRYRIHGLQPGAYYVVAADSQTPTDTGQVPGLRGAARAFYPGASALAQATAVRVDVGVDATGTDMTFAAAPTFRISGSALDSSGEPITWPVALTVSGRSGATMMPPLSARVGFDGAFEFTHVPPGQYVLQAFQMAGREYGRTFIEVTDRDVGPIPLRVAATATISGRIVVTGGRVEGAAKSVRIDVLSADPDYQSEDGLPRAPVFRLDADGTFEVSGLAGPVRFVDATAPAGWWLQSINIDGVNAADDPALFETPDDSRSGVEIVFSTDGAEVSGRAVDSRNEPVATYVAVVLPVDRGRWYAGSRYVKTARPAQQGRFAVAALPPGDYWIAAVDALPEDALRDTDVLNAISTMGRRVSVAAGERLVIDLTVVRLPASAR